VEVVALARPSRRRALAGDGDPPTTPAPREWPAERTITEALGREGLAREHGPELILLDV